MPALLECEETGVGGQDARVRFDEHRSRRRNAGKTPCRFGGREPFDGCTGGRQRVGDRLDRCVIAQRHLAGDVEQSATCHDLEVVPTGAGEDGHLDVTAIGVAEAEDARVAL